MKAESSFGAWLQQRRKALDLTQEELAHRVGCSAGTIRMLEAGTRRPSKQIAELLAVHLSVAPEQRAAFLQFARGQHPIEASPTGTGSNPLHFKLSESQRPTNLAAVSTPLIGRETELATLRERILREDARLITLLGPPGIGKTRLSTELARSLQNDFEHGVFIVSLAPIADPDLVAASVVRTLGLPAQPNLPALSSLKHALRDKNMLLVLDNFEQVLDAASAVAELLAECAWVKVVVTSREPLHLRAERQFVVPALALPRSSPQASANVEDASCYAAIALFVERAQAIDANFQLRAENVAAITAICTGLDGLPLGIELAATWVTVLSCDEIAREIRQSLNFLTVTTRDMPERHRSLRAAFDHSWDLLTPDEQGLLSRLSVFRGGFTREAAEQVAGATLPMLAALVAKSLLRHNKAGRYDLHEFIRQYAEVRLDESGQAAGVRRRYVQTYLALAEHAEPFLLWREPDKQIWRQRLEEEINHLRTALEFGLHDAPDLALRLAAALGRFWYLQAQWSEGRVWLERALEPDPAGQDSHARARALLALGVILKGQSDFPAATERLTESLSIFRALDDRWQVAWVLFHLTQINTLTQSGLDQAMSCAHESLSLFQSANDRWGIALALGQLGSLCLEQKQYGQAIAYLKDSLGIQRDLGDLGAIAGNLNLLGTIARIQGDVAQAQAYFMESLPIFEQLDSKEGLAWTHYKLSIVAVECKDQDRAIRHLHEYLVLSQELGYKLGMITALEGMARAVALSGQAGQFALAARLLGAAAVLREAVHMPLVATDPTAVDPGIATAKAALGEPAWRAEWSIGRSLPIGQIAAEALTPLALAGIDPIATPAADG